MDSLLDKEWHAIFSGTGLQQSLLALALSRSGKHVLHIDANDYYGGAEAALSLQEVKEWAERHAGKNGENPFTSARIVQESDGLGASRCYAFALAPQLIHTRSELLKQLVSSKAFRQIEFLAVGSFFIFQPASDESPNPRLTRIPSTREEVFASTTIPSRSKRLLMKFLKFVLEHDSEAQIEIWKTRESDRLVDFLETDFKLDPQLRSYVVTLTLSLDGSITVGAGLAAIKKHLSSMGVFGVGFAAVYPKWGGLSEVAQVGCRAGAVGGATYMLGVGVSSLQSRSSTNPESGVEITLTNEAVVKSKTLIRSTTAAPDTAARLSRLVAVIDGPLASLFEASVEDAPTPCTAVVTFPAGSLSDKASTSSKYPVYAFVHSSDTGECPSGQCVAYLSTWAEDTSQTLLDTALVSLLTAVSETKSSRVVFRMHYDQSCGSGSFTVKDNIGSFDWLSCDLAFNDAMLEHVMQAWRFVVGPSDDTLYMNFDDREGVNEDEDAFNS